MFSVIIPTCNRNDFLSKCLLLLSPSYQTIKEDFEVIVSDDSKDNVAKSLLIQEFPWVKWVEGSKRGPAANRNKGASIAKGSWFIFIDDDVLPNENILLEYSKIIVQNPNVLAFEGKIIPDDWNLLKNDLFECPVNINGNNFWSANICVERRLFNKIGGFDENITIAAYEDQDLYNRLLKHTQPLFTNNSLVVHPIRKKQIFKPISKIKVNLKNYVYFLKKHNNTLTLSTMIFDKTKIFVKTALKKKHVLITMDEFYKFFIGMPILIYYYIKK